MYMVKGKQIKPYIGRRFKKQKPSFKFNHLMTGGENSYMLKQTYKF